MKVLALFALVFASVSAVRYQWDDLSAVYPPLMDSDSDSESAGNLLISGPKTVVANSGVQTFSLLVDGKVSTATTTKWVLSKGVEARVARTGVTGKFQIPSAGAWLVRASLGGNTAELSVVATTSAPSEVDIWHNGNFLPVHREGPVIFAVKKKPEFRMYQWNIGGQLVSGNVAAANMKAGVSSLTVSVTITPTDSAIAPKTFTSTVTRPTSSVARTRYNIYEMSVSARTSYFKALNSLKEMGVYDYLVEAHLIVAGQRNMGSQATDAHNSPAFTLWHRLYLDVYERALMASGLESGVGAPYWNFGGNVAKDNTCIWTADLLGARTGPVRNGFMANWKSYSNPTAVPKDPITRLPPDSLYPIQSMMDKWNARVADTKLAFPTFAEMRSSIEGIHNYGHVNVGGDMNTMASPNDVAFWLVHMWVEKAWTLWQQNPACKEATMYYGKNRFGQSAADTDKLSPWGVTVSTWMKPSEGAQFSDACTTALCKQCNKPAA